MKEKETTVLGLLKNIDKRATQDFENAYQEFMNICEDDKMLRNKLAMYLQATVINAVEEMFYLMDSTKILFFLQTAMDNAADTFLSKQRNSGE